MQRRVVILAGLLLAAGSLAAPGWATAAVPPSGKVAGLANLNAIACPTTTRCVATGTAGGLTSQGVSVDVATGAATVSSATTDFLDAVACATASACVAVADDATVRVAVATGATTLVRTLTAPTDEIDALSSIACPTASSCYAAGFQGTELHSRAFLVHVAATGAVLGSSTTSSTGFGAIACPTATLCLLAAADGAKPEGIQLLDDGHLGAIHLLAAKTYVQALACFKATACFALAGKVSGSPKADEVISLDPTTGAIETTSVIAGTFSGTGMACATAEECIVVGYTAPLKPAIDVVTKGKAAKVTAVGGVGLAGVACTAAGVCLAVGQQTTTIGLVTRV